MLQPLLASAVVLCGLIDGTIDSSSGPRATHQNSIYNALCRVNCKVLQLLGEELRENKKLEGSERKDCITSLRCCISLYTVLVARGQGSGFSDAAYFKILAETLREYEILPQLLKHAAEESSLASTALFARWKDKSIDNSAGRTHGSESLWIVKAILRLLYSVAETNDSKMVSILPGVEMSRVVVRNPLFSFVFYFYGAASAK